MRRSLRTALEVGYRSIDTAYLYMNEDAIGDELQDWFSKGKLKREEVFVTSKVCKKEITFKSHILLLVYLFCLQVKTLPMKEYVSPHQAVIILFSRPSQFQSKPISRRESS